MKLFFFVWSQRPARLLRFIPLAMILAGLVSTARAESWVGTWAASVQEVEKDLLPEGFGDLSGTTIRQVVRCSLGGGRVRVRLSNAFADWNDELVIRSARIGLGEGKGRIKEGSERSLTFNGGPGVTIPHGVLMVSDPLAFELPAGADLVVTMEVSDAPTKISGHRSARGPYATLAKGSEDEPGDPAGGVASGCWYYLAGIDVWAPEKGGAVVCLGDSITDGKGSTEGENRRWPDLLARRLQANEATAGVGVLNQGIGGNCLWRGGPGQTALQRFERDVLAQPGARWLVVMEGVNDLGGGKTTADEIITALAQIVAQAKDRGLLVHGVTILPFGESFYDKPGLEERRQEVNRWIREGGAFDAVWDWDALVRDPDKPRCLLPVADCGDHLHLSDGGYRILADSIDLGKFEAGGED